METVTAILVYEDDAGDVHLWATQMSIGPHQKVGSNIYRLALEVFNRELGESGPQLNDTDVLEFCWCEGGPLLRGSKTEVVNSPDLRTAWTTENSVEASRMGWDLFMAGDALQLQADADAGIFKYDNDAAHHVVRKALKGSDLEAKALRLLAEYSPAQYATVLQWHAEANAKSHGGA